MTLLAESLVVAAFAVLLGALVVVVIRRKP